ncbi:DUF4160 domain-containing protein [Roseospira visakhapatnamensis]|uniref:DUF4160 domain-containing protein n=1 Tax=Roseospira visakhapatnamensis TaxID=390880 RepID=A0A7W6W924_9PROT|nr:DUF4160 domain-containing protein [Roseospira visakhapatnamensis]MBB4264992.1 hypothetical protein [Roseospira visakhapatnamensis]
MPTLLRIDGFRFYFYSHEPGEPAPVHVDKGPATAKVWLAAVSVARDIGFAAHDLQRIRRLVDAHRDAFREAWDDFFGT